MSMRERTRIIIQWILVILSAVVSGLTFVLNNLPEALGAVF